MGADDQQERPSARARREEGALDVAGIPVSTGWYLAGFTDGEGSFNVSFRPRTDYSFPWKISLCFNISQRDPTVLRLFQGTLGTGTLRQRSDGGKRRYVEAEILRRLELAASSETARRTL